MLYYVCDKTFEGLMTCVFDSFSRKEIPSAIVGKEEEIPLFTDVYESITDPIRADRVVDGLRAIISESALAMLFVCFFSDRRDSATRIFNYIRKTFEAGKSIETNFADDDVLELSKTYRKVQREAERVRQFVRFQKTADGIFFAAFEPAHDVLPLVVPFFEDRFADQPWIIYDMKRKYGFYYDLKRTEEISIDNLNIDLNTGKLPREIKSDDETEFNELWKQYLKSITIAERKNLKLQRQHMPERFWKYLTEKN